MTIEDILAAADKAADALNAEHPKAYEHGRRTGEKDHARFDANPDAYGDDTNPPAHLSGRAGVAWLNGWADGFGL